MQHQPAATMPPRSIALRSPEGLAIAVTVLLAVTAVVYLFAVYTGFVLHGVTGDLVSHTRADIRYADTLYSLSGAMQMMALLATATVFIIWFHRVRGNAEVFTPEACTRGKGWTIGGWFVPIGNLWIPYQVAREIWTASAQTAPDGSVRPFSRRPLTLWWGVWTSSLVIDRLGWAAHRNAETTESLQRAYDITILADVLGVAAALLAIGFVRRLTGMQRRKATEGPYASS
ncbi:DUF4328 domain-containing protein [Streptomyces sp. NPDC048361]|uniref:DUF4328 domain-containing protein n=1 Tax=Streptomyces sp. NPDC048361 TaxID=3154720 RepID=UPI0034178F13